MANYQRTIPLTNCLLSLADIKKIHQRLQACATEEGERQLASLVKPDSLTDEQFENEKQRAREHAYRVIVSVHGADGSILSEPNDGIFSSESLPEEITIIYMSNQVSFEVFFRQRPVYLFTCELHFSKPPLLDSNNFVSSPTPNFSKLVIEGERDTWLSVVADQVMGIIDKKRTNRKWLHAAFVYDAGLYLFGAPIAFYACWKASDLINSYAASKHVVFGGAAYVYLIFAILMIYRVIFGYTKWAFPIVELEEAKSLSAKHRKWWYGAIGAIATTMIVDMMRVWWAGGF